LGLVPLADLCESQAQLVAKSLDATSPAIAPADHRRLDEKKLPAARRPELPVSGNGSSLSEARISVSAGLAGSSVASVGDLGD
jgi:hypothetical protein